MTPITKGMRIGIDVSPLQTGHQYRGVGTYVRNLLPNLACLDRENQYHLFCLDEIQDEFRNLGANFTVEVIRVPQTGRLASVLSHQILLPIRVRELHLNIFHTPFVPTFMASPGLPVFLGCARVTTIHDLIPLVTRSIFGQTLRAYLYYRLMLHRAKSGSAIIVDSQSTERAVIQYLGVDAQKIRVIHLAPDAFFRRLDPEDIKSSFRAISKRYGIIFRYILYVGDLGVVKNLDGLLEALAIIFRSGLAHDLQLVVVGKKLPQHVERLKGKIESLGLWRHVVFTDYISMQDLLVLYNQALVLAFPSLQEGFGLPVLEAMACGTPIIAARTSSIPEIAGEAAILFDPLNPEEIADALRRVLTSEELRESLCKKGYERVMMFTWRETARLTLEVYRSVFARLRSSRGDSL